ncbi:MAG TPA: hypothetical protein VH816_17190 [Gaiellaceae bacterium]
MNLWATALIVAGATALAVGAFLFLRRFMPEGGVFNDGDRAAGVFGVLATGFSVLLGFVVYLAFLSYDTARSGAREEATDVIQQYETAQLLPQPGATKLSGLLVCYGRSVIGVEWPQLQAGHKPAFNPWGLALFEAFKTVHPVTPAQQNGTYPQWLSQTADREQARLDRVQAGSHVIPAPLWIILFVTAILVLVFSFFFADSAEGVVAQGVIIGTIVAMLVTSLLVIRFLDQPYSKGYGGLKPTDMTRVLGQIELASRELGVHPPIPCDAAGRPL